MHIQHRGEAYLIRLERNEELLTSLKRFAHDHAIRGAFFHGLGGASEAKLALYKLESDKQYHPTEFSGELEIVSLNGNIAHDEEKGLVVHCHATIAGEGLQAYGGHVQSMTIAGTCEIFVDLRAGAMRRSHDEEIGLSLLQLDDNE